MNDSIRRAAIALYDRFTHEGMDRRLFMGELTRVAGSAAAANALLLAIAADPAAAAITAEEDKRLVTRRGSIGGAGRELRAYFASPVTPVGKLGSVMVIHENRGLTRHIEDVTRRMALNGFNAVAPDFLSSAGGTPADENAARELIGKLDLEAVTADAIAALDPIRATPRSNGKVGAVGFCWGGAFVNRLAAAAGTALDAGVSYYGPAPDPAQAARVRAPLLIHLAGEDARVNASGEPWVKALEAANPASKGYVYPGVNHAFNNDTSAERYDKAAADLAWQRTTEFFRKHLSA
jgi:carboxymethylenebutenolidase